MRCLLGRPKPPPHCLAFTIADPCRSWYLVAIGIRPGAAPAWLPRPGGKGL